MRLHLAQYQLASGNIWTFKDQVGLHPLYNDYLCHETWFYINYLTIPIFYASGPFFIAQLASCLGILLLASCDLFHAPQVIALDVDWWQVYLFDPHKHLKNVPSKADIQFEST